MESHTPATARTDHLDQLRGLAVAGMITAHAIFFFHDGSNSILMGIQRVLNISTLTIFVFVAGLSASQYHDKTRHIPSRHLVTPTARRLFILYVAYLITALVGIATQAFSNTAETLIGQIVPAILMFAPPNFTEYIPLFILLTVVSLPLRTIYRLTSTSLALTLIAGGFAYLLGFTLYTIDVPSYFAPIKALFAGDGSLLRFPLLFYIPVYLLGLWWQHDTDHNHKQEHQRKKTHILIGAALVSLLSIVLGNWYSIAALDPLTRWPPSVPFLASGLLIGISALTLLPALRFFPHVKSIISYFGRDALDMLVHHLILLFLYKGFIGVQYGNVFYVGLAIFALFTVTTALSSLSLTNNVSFTFRFHPHSHKRLRKRYIVIAAIASVILIWSMNRAPIVSPYGRVMNTDPLKAHVILPSTATARISTNRTWYARHTPTADQVEVSVEIIDTTTNKRLTIDSNAIALYDNNKILAISGVTQENDVTIFRASASDLSIGIHTLSATIRSGTTTATSTHTKVIYVTEPLLVAWTFDWEGWDPNDQAIPEIKNFAQKYAPIPFTHFIHPRTFQDGIVDPERKIEIINFLRTQESQGDEIALHLHMQFDFVSAAGVTPRYTNPWGLRTNEGYDIPTTEYTPEEFRTIIDYAKSQMESNGFTNIRGFRAGGWFINTKQLEMVKNAGFAYDSSGRSKPANGAFRNTPWNLTDDAQPYILDGSDQNIPSNTPGLMEIPNNALTTYESTPLELIGWAQRAYIQTPLNQAKTLVYVSHPQFYEREFKKIPPVLDYLQSISIQNDSGPVVFSTVSNIATLWTSLFY